MEQEARNVNDDDALLELIERAKIRVNPKPGDLSNYREIATSYRKLGDMASAVEWVGYARELESGQADVALEEMESQLLGMDATEIASMEAQLEDDPSNEELLEYVETARGEEQQYRYHQAARMVEKYPNDYGYQFDELGQLLFDMGYPTTPSSICNQECVVLNIA